jgi:uncharacterized protein (DUF433 family)
MEEVLMFYIYKGSVIEEEELKAIAQDYEVEPEDLVDSLQQFPTEDEAMEYTHCLHGTPCIEGTLVA